MPQEDETMLRKNLSLSRRRSFRSGRDRDDRGWSLLHIGSKKGDLKKVKRLLDDGMDVNVVAFGPKSKGISPLHLAAEGGHLDVMDELLDRGANIDARTKGACGWTPLHNAAKERKREAVKFLIENGAFLPDDIDDCRFNPPLHYCPGLEWAYEEMKRLQLNSSSDGEMHMEDASAELKLEGDKAQVEAAISKTDEELNSVAAEICRLKAKEASLRPLRSQQEKDRDALGNQIETIQVEKEAKYKEFTRQRISSSRIDTKEKIRLLVLRDLSLAIKKMDKYMK